MDSNSAGRATSALPWKSGWVSCAPTLQIAPAGDVKVDQLKPPRPYAADKVTDGNRDAVAAPAASAAA